MNSPATGKISISEDRLVGKPTKHSGASVETSSWTEDVGKSYLITTAYTASDKGPKLSYAPYVEYCLST